MSTDSPSSTRFKPKLLRILTVWALIFGQFSAVHAVYAQTPVNTTGNQLFLPIVSSDAPQVVAEEATTPAESGPAELQEVFAAASGAGICSNDNSISCSTDPDCGAGNTCLLPTGGGDVLTSADVTAATGLADTCMNDIYDAFGQGGGLNCTANDVNIASTSSLVVVDGCDFPGDTATFSFVAEFNLTAQARHDVGVYIAEDGGDALFGKCAISNFPYAPDTPWLDLDGLGDSEPGENKPPVPPRQDTCGDIDSNHNPLFSSIQNITVACLDADANGELDINTCLSWRQPGGNDLCEAPYDAFPGAPSKCKCQALPGITIEVPGVLSAVDKVTIDANGNPLPGDLTLFDFTLTDVPTDTLLSVFSLDDDDTPYESPGLEPGRYNLEEDSLSGWNLASAVCTSDQGQNIDLIASGGDFTVNNGESFNCTFTNQQLPPQTGTVSGHVFEDSNGNGVQDTGEPDLAGVDVVITDSQGGTQTVTTDASGDYTATVPPGSTTADVDENTLPAGSVQTAGIDPTTVTAVAGQDTDIGDDGYQPQGTVSGHVYEDTNGNGTQDAGEPDLAGVDVVITDSQGGTQTVTTNANGDYSAAVPAGSTIIDIVDATLPGGSTQTEGTDPTTVTVPSGGTASDIDGYQPPSGTVTGHVYEDTNGNGTQDAGEPDLAGVDVVITDSAGNTQTVTTDANGDYSAAVPAGSTIIDIVDATLPGGSTQTEGTDPTTVTVPSGGTASDIDGYQPPSGTVTGHVYEDTNGNGTQDAGEPNLARVDVVITDSAGNTQTVTTDANGDYSATVPAGSTTIDIDENTLATGSIQTEGTDPTTVTVPSGGTASDIDGYQPPSGTVTGHVYEDTNGNGTQDAGEPNLAGVDVVITDSAGNTQTVTTDANGDYSATVPAGSTTIDIDENTLPAGYTQTEGTDPTTVTVPSGGSASDIDGYQPQGTVSGHVYEDTNGNGTQDAGEPNLAGVDAVITDSAGNTQTVTTDANGDYSATVPAGSTTIDIDENTLPAGVDVQTEGSDPTTVTVPAGGSASDIDGFQPRNPLLSVDKVLTNNADEDTSGDVSLDDTLTYQITASNDGNVTLNNVVVSDSLTGDSTSCLTVAPGGTCVLTVTYVVTQADVDAGQILNTGTADSDETDPVNDPETVPVPQNPALAVDKVLTNNADEDSSSSVSKDDTLEYTITATNVGDVTLNNVVVSDSLTGDSTSCLTVAPGGTCVLTVTYVVTQADVDAGQILNTGTADSDETPPTEDPNTEPVPQNPAIQIVKSSSLDLGEDGIANPGDVINYSFAVTNIGDVTLTDVTVNDSTAGVTDCVIGTMAPGAVDSTTCSGSYMLTQADIDAGSVNNQAFVVGEGPNGDPADPADDVTDDDTNTQDIPQTPVLSVDKVLTSNDDVDNSGDISLGDTLSYQITASNDGNVTLNNVIVSDSLTGDSTSCSALAPGGTCVLTVTYVVTQADVDAGQIVNTGTADSDETPPTEDPNTEPVPQNPSILAEKVLESNADQDSNSTVSLGDTLSYRITATNDGDVTLTNVTVDDDLTGTADAFCAASLAPGESCSVVVSHAVTQANVDAGQIVNTGTVEGTDPNGDPQTDTDPATVDVPQNPSLDLVKSGTFQDENGDGFANVGETIAYAFTVTNDGNVTLSDVTLADTIGGVSVSGGPIVTLAVGASDSTTFAGSYTITQADIDSGSFFNLATATGTDPNGEPTSDTDTHSETLPQNPSLDLVKSGTFQDENGDGFANVGETIAYAFTVTNDGNVTLSDVTLADTIGGVSVSGGPIATLAVGASDSTTFAGSYTITQADIDSGSFFNLATATGTDPNGEPTSDTDTHSETLPQNPVISIVKTFAANTVIAGGAGSSFTLVVTNEGNVTLSNALIEDAVDSRLTVTGVSGTVGADADSDGNAQTVEWLISTLGVGQSATIAVNFVVASSVPAATVNNVSTVGAEAPQGDPGDPGDDITATDDDTIGVLTDINLSIVKTFDPTSVPQGTAQSFTIKVSNAGPSDAVDVSVTDSVHGSLDVTGVSVTSGTGDCSANVGQAVDCTVQIPAGGSVLITVDYLTAPFQSETPIYGTGSGDEFRFVFENGSVLEGSTDGGPVFLDGVDITADVGIVTSLTRNDIVFDPPGDDPAFELHLSCSDPFTGGWGQSGGPIDGVDTNWQIAFFSIARYNSQGFLKSCGNVVNPFDVPNTATATGLDSSGTETVSDNATVTVEPGIKLDRLQTTGKRLTVRLTNFTGDDKDIVDVSVVWPSSNGNLTKVWLTQDGTSVVIWSGTDAPTDALLDASVAGWNGGTLLTGEAILRFDFKNKSASSGYVIRVNFTDGTFLDIAQ